jgi:hypothetical protein
VTWTFGFAEIGTVGLFSPFVHVVLSLVPKVSAATYLRSIQDLLWQLGACFLVDLQVLAAWLIDMFVLPLGLPLVFLAWYFLFHRLLRMIG